MYSAKINGEPTTFGTSGMLYRSNKVMYDRLTNSLWNQLTSEPVIGPLWDSGIKLDLFPIMLTTWKEWLALHPDTTVLAQETGVYPADSYVPEDNPQAIYYDYFNAPDTMFPVPDRDDRLDTKDVVLGVQLNGNYKAYPSQALEEQRIVNDALGGEEIVVMGSATSQGARAYHRGDRSFSPPVYDDGTNLGIPSTIVDEDGAIWQVTEDYLVKASDESDRLARIPTHMSFWFGWFQFHQDTELYVGPDWRHGVSKAKEEG